MSKLKDSAERRWKNGFLLSLTSATIIISWFSFSFTQRFHWGAESYYNFGWYVLPGFFILLYLRLRDMPEMQPCEGHFEKWILCLLGIVLTLLIIPLRLINEVNLFWRIPFLLQGILLLNFSYIALYLYGGKPCLKHFCYALLFLLTMVPWPYRIEVLAIQGLTAIITHAAVLIITLLGYPNELKGNTIIIGTSWLGVDEACSGIRSLQTLLMVAFWLGEFTRLRLMRRVYLIISAVLLTIILNIIRATGLSLVAFHGGTSSYENWHDPMGIITFLISILVLYVCAEKLDNYGVEKEKLSVGKLDKIPFLALSLLCIFSLTTSILLPVITAMWFQPGDAMKLPDRWLLDISKKESTKIEELEIPERIQDILGYDYGSRYRINLGLGRELELYSYGYTGEDRMSSVSSYGHSPYVCIEGIGGEISHVYEPFEYAGESGVLFAVNHVQFTIDFETGEKSESDLFWIVSENNALGINPEKLSSLNYHLQWQMLKARRRDFSRHVMLAVISNSASAVKARELFKEILDEAIVLNDED